MPKHTRQFRKNVALEMRKKGLSYSEIENATSISKSTLSSWLRDVKLTETQSKKLDERRREALRIGAKKKISNTEQLIEKIKSTSAENVKNITKRELWLMGIMLYWRERMSKNNDTDIRRGVRFTSSDPNLIKLFLVWLKDIGNLDESELRFDIFLRIDAQKRTATEIQAIRNSGIVYWANVCALPKTRFNHIYIQKDKISRKKDIRKTSEVRFGFLRIRVRSSSMLARQIAGWIHGIQRFYWSS